MPAIQIEYVGFESLEGGREYTLRVRNLEEDELTFVRIISDKDFLDGRARYQDGPEICFLALQREVADTERRPPRRSAVNGEDLASYKEAHAPRPPRRKPHPPLRP